MSKYAVFILTHGRPNNQLTLQLLKRIGYTGQIYLVLDNLDDTLLQYQSNYKDAVTDILVFDKKLYAQKTDTGNNNPILGCGVYARNAIEDFAKQFNLDAHIQADDDIKNFRYRWIEDDKVKSLPVSCNGDMLLDAYVNALLQMGIANIGFATNIQYLSKSKFFNQTFDCFDFPYNFIIRNNSLPVDWIMNFSDDYTTQAVMRGRAIYSIQTPFVCIDNSDLFVTAGGMADSYSSQNEYTRSMYIKMVCPNAITIIQDVEKIKSIKHRSPYTPKIVSQSYRKEISNAK